MITKNIIAEIVNELATKRPTFCSEADFQFELASSIKEYLTRIHENDFKIFLEYCIKIKNKPIYIDILIKIKDKWYPIELKYKTKANKENNQYKLTSDTSDTIKLKNHAAHDINCYKYLWDIKRIEDIKEKFPSMFERGYAIILTNDDRYLIGPKTSSYYYDFRIKNERKIPGNAKLKWNKNTSPSTIKGCEEPISFKNKNGYNIKWQNYGNKSLFSYLVTEIK